MNTATVTSPNTDPNPANNSPSVTTLVVTEQADVLVEKSGPTVVLPGVQIEYVARVVNRGPAPALDVVWADSLPGGTTFVSGTPPPAPTTCTVPPAGSTGLATCTTPVLEVGATLEFRFVVEASPDLVIGAVLTNVAVTLVATTLTTGRFENVATVSAAEPDPVPANNTATQPTTVGNAADADLSIEKVGPMVLGPGDTTVYTLLVTNRARERLVRFVWMTRCRLGSRS